MSLTRCQWLLLPGSGRVEWVRCRLWGLHRRKYSHSAPLQKPFRGPVLGCRLINDGAPQRPILLTPPGPVSQVLLPCTLSATCSSLSGHSCLSCPLPAPSLPELVWVGPSRDRPAGEGEHTLPGLSHAGLGRNGRDLSLEEELSGRGPGA